MPSGAPTFYVIEIETGATLSEWDSLAEARASLAFARIDPDTVTIEADTPMMTTLTSWRVAVGSSGGTVTSIQAITQERGYLIILDMELTRSDRPILRFGSERIVLDFPVRTSFALQQLAARQVATDPLHPPNRRQAGEPGEFVVVQSRKPPRQKENQVVVFHRTLPTLSVLRLT